MFGNDLEFRTLSRSNYDPEKAKSLLAELGRSMDNPLQTAMLVLTGGNHQKLAEVFQAQMAETRVLTDTDARKAKPQEVFKYLLENAIHVPLYTPGWEWVFAIHPEVESVFGARFSK